MEDEYIHWQSKYELGVEAIDIQHQYFVSLINRLAIEMKATDNDKYRESMLDELRAYARFHFISEENLMLRAGYPQLAEHKQHHRDLIERLSIRLGMMELEHSEKSYIAILEFLADWFLHHTNSEDRKFSEWAAANGVDPGIS